MVVEGRAAVAEGASLPPDPSALRAMKWEPRLACVTPGMWTLSSCAELRWLAGSPTVVRNRALGWRAAAEADVLCSVSLHPVQWTRSRPGSRPNSEPASIICPRLPKLHPRTDALPAGGIAPCTSALTASTRPAMRSQHL